MRSPQEIVPRRGYRGTDRRQRMPASRQAGRRALAILGIVAVVCGVLVPPLVGAFVDSAHLSAVRDGLRVTSAAMFFGASALRYSRWRLTGEASVGLCAVALAVFGALTLPFALASGLVQDAGPARTLSPLTQVITTSVCLGLLGRALLVPEVTARLNVRWVGFAAGLIALDAFAALVVAHQLWAVSLDPSHALMVALELAMAAGWATVAVAFVRRGRRQGRITAYWSAATLGLLAANNLLRAAAVGHQYPWLLSASAMLAIAATVVLISATADLFEVFAYEGDRFVSLSTTLADTEQVLTAAGYQREELVHDARSVIAALRAASHTLHRYGGRLDEGTRDQLRSAVVSELGRLEQLIDRPPDQGTLAFCLEEALGPVVAAQRQTGLVVHARLAGARAVGRPADLATVVQNLLVNAGHYAPGSAVDVWVDGTDGAVAIHVADRGPGVPAAERHTVFERGARGSTSEGVAGCGLGLFVCRRLMGEMGGRITLAEPTGAGAEFVLSLPAPAAPTPALTGVPRQRHDRPAGTRPVGESHAPGRHDTRRRAPVVPRPQQG